MLFVGLFVGYVSMRSHAADTVWKVFGKSGDER